MDRIKNILLKYKYTILFSGFLFFIYFYPEIDFPATTKFVAIFTIIIFLNLLAKIRYTQIVTVAFSVLLIVNAVVVILYRSFLELGMLSSILNTDVNETISVLTDMGPQVILVSLVVFFLVFKTQKELKDSLFSIKNSLIIVFAYSFLLMPLLMYRRIAFRYFPDYYSEKKAYSNQREMLRLSPIIYSNAFVYYAYKKEMEEIAMYAARPKVLPDGIKPNNSVDLPSKILIIAGESANARHHSLYGYPLKTTPFMDSLYSQNKLKYYKSYASASYTRYALPMILTFSTPRNFAEGYAFKSVLNLASDRGYSTFWISNQNKIDTQDAHARDNVAYTASGADKKYYTRSPYYEDLDVVDFLKNLYDEDNKQLFVIHLAGSHIAYKDRYDKIDRRALDDESVTTIAYDRSIHHTDRVIREIYNVAKQSESFLIYYISDHGEIPNLGHGILHCGIEQFEIPLVTINNSKLNLDSLMMKYQNNEVISSSSSISILAEALGYSVSDSNYKRVLEESSYTLHGDGGVREFSKIIDEFGD